MKSSATLGLVLALGTTLAGCMASHDVDATFGALSVFPANLTADCFAELRDSTNNGLPEHLHCTGLYSDIANRTIADGVQKFTPARQLWSDGAQKQRWIYLPDGETIDATSPSAWKFPVGTRFWKEFATADNSRIIETRIYMKNEDAWAKASYQWDDAQKDGTRNDRGADLMVDGSKYRLPNLDECDSCHGGRPDKVMGFEQIMLGMPSDQPQEITLADLVDKKTLKGFDGPTTYKIGQDDTTQQALSWLHINCGVSCHNDNPNADGNTSNDMRLILDPSLLDGREASQFRSLTTTIGRDATALQWVGNKRIVAGDPTSSLLYTLITQREDKQQMPPIASYQVDNPDTAIIKDWITALSPTEAQGSVAN
jgi:hypothetical protein